MTTRPPSPHAQTIWHGIAHGRSHKDIAQELGIEQHTVRNVLIALGKRHGVRNDRVVLALLYHGIRL